VRLTTTKEFFRQQYFAACDLLIQEFSDRFEQKDLMQSILAMESVLIKSANGENYVEELKQVKESRPSLQHSCHILI